MLLTNRGIGLAIYDGVVTLSDNDISVIVELGDETVRLSASGTEIGEWSTDECDITKEDATTYLIHAESDTLPFTPTQPGAFAAAVGLSDERAAVAHPPQQAKDVSEVERGSAEAPPPRPLTLGLFYALCTATLGLAVWALISIAF